MELTPKEQRAILDGKYPPLVGLERFEVGQTFELTSRVSVRIEKRNLLKGKVVWDYTVIDFRSTFMRRTPHDHEPSKPRRREDEEDERYAERVAAWRRRRFKPTTPSEIEAARMDGNYTQSHTRAVPESDDVVPSDVQNVLTLKAHARWAEHRTQENSEAEATSQAKHLHKQIRDMALGIARSGSDPVPFLAGIQREITTERNRRRNAA